MPSTPVPAKKQPLTLAQLAAYDDILTDALVDHAFYWTTIPKNRPSYHASRGVKEEEITKIIQQDLILNPDIATAERKLLATEGLKKFYNGLKTSKEKDDFQRHLRRYMQIYLPDCPFEVTTTNRYTITTHEAAVTARRLVKKNEAVKYLSGVQVIITPDEEKALSRRKKDFSIVVSSRNKCASLFMGPARFANHDCGSNARLMTTGQAGIEIIATRDIPAGEEITVTYGDNYFGEDNCECLCQTCEDNLVNGWKQEDGASKVKKSIEELVDQGYSLRRRPRRDDSAVSSSRTPSVTPDIRPKIRKSRSQLPRLDSSLATLSNSPAAETTSPSNRKREYESLTTPPVTPAKKRKTSHYEVEPLAMSRTLSQTGSDISSRSNSGSELGARNATLTDATTPEETSPGPTLHSTALTQPKENTLKFKQEETDPSSLMRLNLPPSMSAGDALTPHPIPSIEVAASPEKAQSNTIPASGTLNVGRSELLADPTTLTQSGPISATLELDCGPPRRGRGRPRGPSTRSAIDQAATPPPHFRTPRDYTLTPLLLSEPHMAWIHCTVCTTAFVQHDAYYTRSSCPRCERHSKLYGYIWPKTERAGKHDKEERILDHRTIHRFLDADDEAKIRGRKRIGKSPLVETMAVPFGHKQNQAAETEGNDLNLRRSGRRRHPSAKAVTL